jgi:hypothetical protein
MPSAKQNERTGDAEPPVRSLKFVPKVRNKFQHDLIKDLHFKTCLANLTLACDGLMCIIITLHMTALQALIAPPKKNS